MKKTFKIYVSWLIVIISFSACNNSVRDNKLAKEKDSIPEVNTLIGEKLDAMELLIVVNSNSTANSWNQQLTISPEITTRLSKYSNDSTTYYLSADGIESPLLSDGAKTIVPNGATFDAKFEGLLNANIKIVSGEFGIINGKIFVKDSTKAIINDTTYCFLQDQWIQIENLKN
jgi:hypothetical protein